MNQFRRIIGKIAHVYYIHKSKNKPIRGSVLTLHGISDDVGEFDVTVDDFENLLRFLKTKNTIRLENWENENNFYALTFDDVLLSFYEKAYPLLKKYQIPFTIFVNTSMLGEPKFINESQLAEISNCALCTVGSHGVSHDEFQKMNTVEALEDLKQSKQTLEQMLHRNIDMYAFPYGSYYACGYNNKHLATDIYKYGFSMVKCPITKPSVLPAFFLPRINVDSKYISNLSNS